jgi:hypothetical protein
MRKIIGFIIFLIIIFIVNLVFYFLSDDYRFFLKKIKDTNQIVYLEDKVINDNDNDKVTINKEEEKILE